jgi:hypothetical protein
MGYLVLLDASLFGPKCACLLGPKCASLLGPKCASLFGPKCASLFGPRCASLFIRRVQVSLVRRVPACITYQQVKSSQQENLSLVSLCITLTIIGGGWDSCLLYESDCTQAAPTLAD